MRIYSNTILSWPQVLHVSAAARRQLRPGRWQNYYFYRVGARDFTNIITYSPISFLQENRSYYCYDRLYRNKLTELGGNVNELASINGKTESFATELCISIPYSAAAHDIIVIEAPLLLH